ncbi:MAG: linear amide C-N hydrolase [bacterium]|nr:linear amide C-N hydrolase [bacterium]
MNKHSKLVACLAACAMIFLSSAELEASGKKENDGVKCEKTWKSAIIEHKGFKDLGNYIIEMPDYTDPSTQKRGLAFFNKLADHGKLPKLGCTALAKKNSKGEVIMGRNMDLDISQSAAYVFKTTFGKYKNACVTYSPNFYVPYEELQKLDDIDQNIKDSLIYLASDCMNEKGLYIEMNLREKSDKHMCYGLHSTYGEKTRDDGTPWSELRACTIAAPQLVSQNCATVQEAIDFLNNSYDWYTIVNAPNSNNAVNNNNMCFMIGDATGEYGLIEIAQDEVNYIPYQFGQANFYITPKWNALETHGAGQGRLDMASKVITYAETLDDAMEAMKPIMWRNETLWIGESERMPNGSHAHPYNQIIFQDNHGTPQMDWRGDYAAIWPVMDDGRMIMSADLYEIAKKSTYDPNIKEFFDDGIARGRLVIDDGSFKFNVNGRQVTFTELSEKNAEYATNAKDPKKQAELKPYSDEYCRLLENENSAWVYDDHNFEALKAVAYAELHIRYNDKGEFDPSCMSKYEKLLTFYGYGTKKDEKPLRDDGSIWTTSLNVGANCAQKEMKIRFWENDKLIYHVKFSDDKKSTK